MWGFAEIRRETQHCSSQQEPEGGNSLRSSSFPSWHPCSRGVCQGCRRGFVLLESCWRAHAALTLFIPGQSGMFWCLLEFLSHRNSSGQFSLLGHSRETNPACLHIIFGHSFAASGWWRLLPATSGRDGLYGIGTSLKAAGGKFGVGASIPKNHI